MGDAVKQISDALERIFRHLLPGICLVIAVRLSRPSWLRCVDYSQSQQLLLLGIIAVCAGNIWYIFHRYSVHQLIDWVMYLISTKPHWGYHKWLIGHISGSFRGLECKPVEMRAAQVIFMCIVCEIAIISARYHEQYSWFGQIGHHNRLIVIVVALIFLGFAIWQHYVLFNVDREVVANQPASDGAGKRP
jgi:hypothetical protein